MAASAHLAPGGREQVVTVLSQVVEPLFSIVTVTIAVSPGSILVGTPEYDTNDELSAATATPAVNASARKTLPNAPRRRLRRPPRRGAATWSRRGQSSPARRETNTRATTSTSPTARFRPVTAQRPEAPMSQASEKASASTIAGDGVPPSCRYEVYSSVIVSQMAMT